MDGIKQFIKKTEPIQEENRRPEKKESQKDLEGEGIKSDNSDVNDLSLSKALSCLEFFVIS